MCVLFTIVLSYYWGDRHFSLFLGPERAARINPIKSAIAKSLVVTSHHDSPVTSPSSERKKENKASKIVLTISVIEIIHHAMNRKTAKGMVLGANERVDLMEVTWNWCKENVKRSQQAIECVTINAAIQLGLHDSVGSIRVGKRADFVVLNCDPRTVEPNEFKDKVKVVQTVFGGNLVFEAKSKL